MTADLNSKGRKANAAEPLGKLPGVPEKKIEKVGRELARKGGPEGGPAAAKAPR